MLVEFLIKYFNMFIIIIMNTNNIEMFKTTER